jgi:hypothetical protein
MLQVQSQLSAASESAAALRYLRATAASTFTLGVAKSRSSTPPLALAPCPAFSSAFSPQVPGATTCCHMFVLVLVRPLPAVA